MMIKYICRLLFLTEKKVKRITLMADSFISQMHFVFQTTLPKKTLNRKLIDRSQRIKRKSHKLTCARTE